MNDARFHSRWDGRSRRNRRSRPRRHENDAPPPQAKKCPFCGKTHLHAYFATLCEIRTREAEARDESVDGLHPL